MASRRQASIQDCVQRLLLCTEIESWSKEFIEDLQLAKQQQDLVLFTCMQILAVRFAITDVFKEDSAKREALVASYE